MPTGQFLHAAVRTGLTHIEPSIGIGGANTQHFPCMAKLKTGEEIACVCFMTRSLFISTWGVEPKDDPGKKSINPEDVASVASSPFRLPAAFANRLYGAGESGMGYMIFVVQFRDGSEQAHLLGNLVDFINYPAGKVPHDVTNVFAHMGREFNACPGPEYSWCLYDE